MKRPSCGDSPLAMTPKSLRYKSRGRGNMRKSGGINGSKGRLDRQPALGREEYYVENFPFKQELGIHLEGV
jgi:hypothetical protein